MGVTLQEVAKAARVSVATVSRVLSGRGAELFAAPTRRRIEETAQRLGYRPNHTARALVTGRTGLVTLWSYHPYHAFFAMVMEEVQKQSRNHGYGLLVADVAVREPEEPGPALGAWPSDGILAMECGQWAQAVLKARPSPQTPVVSMGTNVIPKTDSVRVDMGKAFREATEHLLEQGCRRIAYCSLAFDEQSDVLATTFAEPRDAYRKLMHERGLSEEWVGLELPTRGIARETIASHIRKNGPPDAILCRNDDLAIGAYRALCDLGLAVGKDVLLVGCDGIQDTQFLHCPLSTIVLPVAEMCQQAWQFLETRMANPSAPRQQAVLEGKLVIRESSEQSRKKGNKKERTS